MNITSLLMTIYILSVIIYFLYFRHLVKKDAFDVIKYSDIIGLLVTGLIPLINIVIMIILSINYGIASNDLTPKEFLKKIFFVR